MPKRIQRKRTKGWKMPRNTVYVGRPTKWGNPWSGENREKVIAKYRSWLAKSPLIKMLNKNLAMRELRGQDLACWCPLDQPCHADVLLEIANS